MSSALSNSLTSCQKKTSDIALSISRATSQASTKVAGSLRKSLQDLLRSKSLANVTAYGCAVRLGVSDLLQINSVPRVRFTL